MLTQIEDQTLHIIVENLPAAILLIDQDYKHIYSNSAFQTLSSLHTFQVAENGWWSFLTPNQHKQLLVTLREMSDKPEILVRKNREWTVNRALDTQNKVFFLITFAGHSLSTLQGEKANSRQPSDRQQQNKKQSAAELKKINHQLSASNQLKDKILAIISHDMNAPIASLKGLTAALLDEELDRDQRALVREGLLKQLSDVADVTENLLLWATNSFHKTETASCDVLPVLDTMERNRGFIEQQALAKNIVIHYNIPDQLQLKANRDQFNMVIRNLVMNAIKYTPVSGSISISAVDNEAFIQISISDNGIGISEENQQSLFTFKQRNTYGTNGEKGIGLGLLLCKEYVEANNGKISVSSKVNIGTTVITQFPRA
jgi:signal transduction histidine kinase